MLLGLFGIDFVAIGSLVNELSRDLCQNITR